MVSCAGALIVLSMLPHLLRGTGGNKVANADIRAAVGMLHAAAALLSFTSATVVSSLTALASLQCDEEPSQGVPLTALKRDEPGQTTSTAAGSSTSVSQVGSGGSVRTRPSAPRAKGRVNPALKEAEKRPEPVEPQRPATGATNDNVTVVRNAEGIPIGRALGEFRSAGQLGRAIGPLMGTFAVSSLDPTD
jgi:hypothetical protein